MTDRLTKRPAFQWYPGDHRRDTGVQVCSFTARALWREMLDVMHEGDPYGHLAAGGEAIEPEELSRLIGLEMSQVASSLKELERRKVFSRTENGIIFCRRMVRDETKREMQAAEGKKGGSPSLGIEYNVPGFVYAMQRSIDGAVKIGISVQPAKRLYKVRQQFSTQTVELVGTMLTDDMGAAEAKLHRRYKAYCLTGAGEWFHLPPDEYNDLLVRLKGKPKAKGKEAGEEPDKVKAPPSVAVASSTSRSTTPPERIYAFMGEMSPVWQTAYGGPIPPGTAKRLKPLVDQFGSQEVATRLANYLATTDAQFASIPRFVSTYGHWNSAKPNGTHRTDESVKRGYLP